MPQDADLSITTEVMKTPGLTIAAVSLSASLLFGGEPGAVDVETGAAQTRLVEEWADLASPWYALRREAGRRLVHLPPAEALYLVQGLLDQEEARFRLAAADWLLERFRRGEEVDGGELGTERRVLLEAIRKESDLAVRDRMVQAAAHDEQVTRTLTEAGATGRVDRAVLSAVLEARIIVTLEQVMHEGRVPGFFDGQFAAVLAVDKTAYPRLIRFAWDARLHFVIRALSIMAVHESRHGSLLSHLKPLIARPAVEIRQIRQTFWGQGDSLSIREYIHAKLSQYARFSLAKAGIAEPIEQKIRQLESEADKSMRIAEAFKSSGDDSRHDVWIDRAMSYLFELGYHHQQLDHYDRAEQEYRKIIQHEGRANSTRWAHYNLACIRAIQGRNDEAIDELRRAVQAGFKDTSWARRDGDLQPLHEDPRFHRILTDLEFAEPEEDSSTKPAEQTP